MDEELHLPWDRASLEALAKKIISLNEADKVDLKSSFDLSDVQHKAELLKDISAIANTYSQNYKNYGFIIFGAAQNSMTYTNFQNNEDHVQSTIDDLVKKYLGPFVITHFFIFNDEVKQWGVLVIPPSKNLPHVFINDTHKRSRGDIYVRNGTNVLKAQPEDFSRFFNQYIEHHTYEMRQQIIELQRELSNINKKIKIPKKHKSHQESQIFLEKKSLSSDTKIGLPISEEIDQRLTTEKDLITKGLLEEVKKIKTFISSEEIPWLIQDTNKLKSVEIFSKIEAVSNEFWMAISNICLKDRGGVYEESLITAISYLSDQIEPPPGTTYSEWGQNIRYFPLLVCLYLISIICVEKKRWQILKKIIKLELKSRFQDGSYIPLVYILFLTRRANEIFHPMFNGYPDQKWLDPIASYTKIVVDKILNPDDLLWEKEKVFFNGEFILCISPMDILEEKTKSPFINHPSSGLYLHISSARPIISRFLKTEKELVQNIFDRSLQDLLSTFDQTALNIVSSFGSYGFRSGAIAAAYPNK